jgi:hypothetical protein
LRRWCGWYPNSGSGIITVLILSITKLLHCGIRDFDFFLGYVLKKIRKSPYNYPVKYHEWILLTCLTYDKFGSYRHNLQ